MPAFNLNMFELVSVMDDVEIWAPCPKCNQHEENGSGLCDACYKAECEAEAAAWNQTMGMWPNEEPQDRYASCDDVQAWATPEAIARQALRDEAMRVSMPFRVVEMCVCGTTFFDRYTQPVAVMPDTDMPF